MANGSESDTLLREIRDAQRALLEEYRRVANESLALQRQALEAQRGAITEQQRSVRMQASAVRAYRLVLVGAIPLIGFILWLIVRLSAHLLR